MYTPQQYKIVNGILYNTLTRQGFDLNNIDGNGINLNGTRLLGAELGIDPSRINMNQFQVDNNYDPKSGKSGGVNVNPFTGAVDNNYDPTAPVPSNFNKNPNGVNAPAPGTTPPIAGQIGAIPTSNNGVGNSTSGNQVTPTTPQVLPTAGNGVGNSTSGGQVGASIGNISQQMTPQDQQRQAIGTDPNNITGYQNMNPIS